MPLAAYVCRADDEGLMEAARGFLGELRDEEATTTVADGEAIAPLVARALGMPPEGSSDRVAVDPGSVTVLRETEDGDVTVAMANVLPGDPLRRAASPARRLYVVRHGEADTPSADGHLHSHVPLPLTPRGRRQAQALGAAFAAVPFAVAHASPIERTAQTARALAGPGREVRLHGALRELSLGELEGAHVDDILDAAPGFLIDPDAALPGGDSIREVSVRAGDALDEILAADDAPEVVVVAHGGVNRGLLGRLLRIPMERAMVVRQDWAGVNVLESSGDGWVAATLNWTPEGLGEFSHAHRTRHLHERVPPTRRSGNAA
jgi:broad specificity phosphatase PhoE